MWTSLNETSTFLFCWNGGRIGNIIFFIKYNKSISLLSFQVRVSFEASAEVATRLEWMVAWKTHTSSRATGTANRNCATMATGRHQPVAATDATTQTIYVRHRLSMYDTDYLCTTQTIYVRHRLSMYDTVHVCELVNTQSQLSKSHAACLTCMWGMHVRHACLTCKWYRYTCETCMWDMFHMHASHVCEACMPHIHVSHARLTRISHPHSSLLLNSSFLFYTRESQCSIV